MEQHGASATDPRCHVLRHIKRDGVLVRCRTDAGDIVLPAVPARFLSPGDEVLVPTLNDRAREYLASRPAAPRKLRQIFFGSIGCVTPPRLDSRNQYYLRADVRESGLGVKTLHFPSSAVRDYFYAYSQPGEHPQRATLYEALGVAPTATPADLRLAYRVRRIELETTDVGTAAMRRAERAFNLLAHPDFRSCYDTLLRDPDAPALYPYGGFGECVVAGDLAEDGQTFFVRRVLSYRADQRRRQFRVPLRRIDLLNGYVCFCDSRRRAEVFLDPTLLSIDWDPTWAQWRHLVGTKIAIAGAFVQSCKYRHVGGQWHLVRWETALPSRLSISVPADAQQSLSSARRTHARLGQYHDAIERVRARLAREPLDQRELAELCRTLGIPSDLDIAQFCWKPDYDRSFYDQLRKRSQNVYFLRDEFIFQLSRVMAAEIPEMGHATYIFAKPADVCEFVRGYAAVSRDDIRKNRANVGNRLGFIGRVRHGRNPRLWLRELRSRIGEAADYTLSIDPEPID